MSESIIPLAGKPRGRQPRRHVAGNRWKTADNLTVRGAIGWTRRLTIAHGILFLLLSHRHRRHAAPPPLGDGRALLRLRSGVSPHPPARWTPVPLPDGLEAQVAVAPHRVHLVLHARGAAPPDREHAVSRLPRAAGRGPAG